MMGLIILMMLKKNNLLIISNKMVPSITKLHCHLNLRENLGNHAVNTIMLYKDHFNNRQKAI